MFTDILEAEIKWCENNDGAMPEEFRKGFIAGLKQAIYLINAALQRIGWEEGVLENDGVWLDMRGLTLHEAVQRYGDNPVSEDSTGYSGSAFCECTGDKYGYFDKVSGKCLYCNKQQNPHAFRDRFFS